MTNQDYIDFREERSKHYDTAARNVKDLISWSRKCYKKRLQEIYQFLIPPGEKIIEFGCGEGDLLASLRPSVGVGIDFSKEMITMAKLKHPGIYFHDEDAYGFSSNETFDFIILSDLVNDLWDVQGLFQKLGKFATPRTQIIMNFYSRLWELPLLLAQKTKMALPMPVQNWITVEDADNMLQLSGYEVIRNWREILFPLPIPIIAPAANRFLVKLWPFNHLALTNFIIARKQPKNRAEVIPTRVSVIIPARNEAGNIPNIFSRIPNMGDHCELIFVEGNSDDDTFAAIHREINSNPERSCKLLKQSGKGKGDAVRMGFQHAQGNVLMILDADLTVAPEDLPKFLEVLRSGKGEFVNGVRLIYPMEDHAMRFFNLLGNKFFSLAFSWLLGQPIKDTLCGTKVLWKRDYELIKANRSYFGDFDPFGDFDLIFGAAKRNFKIVDLPIRYRQRKYGSTNIHRWKHGWLLIKMLCYAAVKLKFV